MSMNQSNDDDLDRGSIIFRIAPGKELLRFTRNGKIILSQDYPQDELVMKFLDLLAEVLPFYFKKPENLTHIPENLTLNISESQLDI